MSGRRRSGSGRAETMVNAERLRLDEAESGGVPWRRWGPYPHWRDLLLFYEYFHGDNGAGLGASHQTGWTGTAGLLPLLFRGISGEGLRTCGRCAIRSAAAGQQTGAA
jgi:hypothetical protein